MARYDQLRRLELVGTSLGTPLATLIAGGLVLLTLSACGSSGATDGATGGGQSGATGGATGGGQSGATGGATGGGQSGATGGGGQSGGASSAGASGGASGSMSSSGGSVAAGRGGRAGNGGSTGGVLGGAAGAPNGKGGAGSGGTAGAGTQSGVVDCRHDGDGKTTLAFVNRCAQALTFAGSDIKGGALGPGEHKCVDVGSATEVLSAKRYWAFKGEDPGAEHHSLAEFTFNTDFNDFDWYNISYVDAFNLPMQLVPVARASCKTLTCSSDFISGCPEVGRYENGSGQVVACVSPDRNDGNSAVARYFEACDDAYAWSGDDQNGTDPSPVRACAGEDWDIVFCP